MDPSSRTRDWLPSVLILKGLFITGKYLNQTAEIYLFSHLRNERCHIENLLPVSTFDVKVNPSISICVSLANLIRNL